MVVAAFLLLAIGLVELLVIAVALVQDEHTPTGQILQYGPCRSCDLVLAAGLFRGNQKFRGWGLGRSVLGAILIVLALLTSTAPAMQWAYSGFELCCARDRFAVGGRIKRRG